MTAPRSPAAARAAAAGPPDPPAAAGRAHATPAGVRGAGGRRRRVGRARRAGAGQCPGAAGGLVAVAWSAFLVGCLAALHAVGGPLAPPPLSDPAGVGPWLAARAPAEAAVAVARLVALALAWYLLAATAAGLLARLSGAAVLVGAADALSVPLVRRVVHGAVSLSIAAAASGASTGAAHAAPPPAAVPEGAAAGRATTAPPPTMRLLPSAPDPGPGPPAGPGAPDAPPGSPAAPPGGATGTSPGGPEPSSGPPDAPPGSPAATTTGSGPPDAPPGSPAATTTVPAGADAPAGSAPAATGPLGPAGATTGERRWTVRPGDHLWAVAERTLAEAWGRPPADAEVDPYWRAVVEANRAVLRDPANADLVFPGQVLVVPPVPGGDATGRPAG